ncbi:hypothetical protein AC578_1137 [Pseudocercospora eumusae]|uniref:Autophagy-related protein 3 n=1 Tax=Pseudocercospora eumusae TaxID=321146 RepID=A0A139HJY2_9PEZI|nr:hypothetical protein AC578_1137 [Pseudocercospora eumusae]
MVTSFKRRISSTAIIARPCTPLSTKSKKCGNVTATRNSLRSDGRRSRADSVIEVNRKAFQQNQNLSCNEGQQFYERGSHRSSGDRNSIISFREALQDDAMPRRPDTPAHFAFPQIGSPCSTNSFQSKKGQHDRNSKDTDMLPPEQLHGYEDCVPGSPYSNHRSTTLPKHKSALTRIVQSRHQVHVIKPDSRPPSSQRASLLSPDRGKLVDDLEASTKELGETKQRLSKAEQEISALRQQLAAREHSVKVLNADIANKREGMRKTAELCTSLSSELQDLKSTQGKGPLSLARHQRKVNENLKLDNRDLTKKLKQALRDAGEMEQKWKRAQSRATDAYSHLKTCAQHCRDLKAFVRSQDKRIEEQDEAHAVMTRESQLKQAELLEAKATIKKFRSVQADLNDTKASLRNVKAANQQIAAERDAAEDEIGRLEQRLNHQNQNLGVKSRAEEDVESERERNAIMQNLIHSFIDPLRDRFAPISHNSDFRNTGQITPEEFQAAGDFLVHKFPSWSWGGAASESQRVSYFPADKQYLITRGVPCRKRIKADDFAGAASGEDQLVLDMLRESGSDGGEDDGWLKAGGNSTAENKKDAELMKDVKTVDDDGKLGEEAEEEEIPDMDDEEDDEEAIIRDPSAGKKDGSDGLRTYTLYITYTPYYRTPRLYLSGYDSNNKPLLPIAMMEDIVGDYKDKTVTLEDFNFTNPPIKTASVHPCKHASVMKVLLDRADAALKLRIEKMKHGEKPSSAGMEGLVDQTSKLDLKDRSASSKGKDKDGEGEWEVLSSDGSQDEEAPAIRVDQYLVVFLKFMASVTPGIEHDFTMGV